MPLKRGPDGKLGVAGGGGSTVVNVIVENHSGQQVQRKESSGADGSREIRFIIAGIINEDLQQGGPISRDMERTYKLQRRTA